MCCRTTCAEHHNFERIFPARHWRPRPSHLQRTTAVERDSRHGGEGGGARLREDDDRQRQVEEAVLEALDGGALQQLHQLHRHLKCTKVKFSPDTVLAHA